MTRAPRLPPSEGIDVSGSGRLVYFNGALVPEAEARVSIYDSALMFGDMVFEMTRSFGKKPVTRALRTGSNVSIARCAIL